MNKIRGVFSVKAIVFILLFGVPSLCQAYEKQIMDSYILTTTETRTHLVTTGVLHSNLGPSAINGNEFRLSLQLQRKHREHFDLLWSPLPLGFIYEPLSDQHETMAVSWNLETAYSTQTGFEIDPTFRSFYRHRFSTTMALASTLFYGMRYFFQKENPNSWFVGTFVGPFFQLDPQWAASLKAGLKLEEVREESRWEVRPRDEFTGKGLKPIFPMQFELSRHLAEKTKVELQYNYSGLGRWFGFEIHEVSLRWSEDW